MGKAEESMRLLWSYEVKSLTNVLFIFIILTLAESQFFIVGQDESVCVCELEA